MNSGLRRLFLIAALLLAQPLWADEPVRIGVLAFRPKPQTLAQWQPLAEELKRQIPQRDFVIEPLDYPEVEQAVASRKIDFVLTNPGHYVYLAQRSGLSSPLVSLVSEENGHPIYAYGGAIFTLADRKDIVSIEDVQGKKVAVVTDDSLGGYQMQAYELAIRGIPLPGKDKLVKTGMPHDRAVEAVLNGQAEVGFARSGVLESMAREGKLDMSKVRILNRQDMPTLPWALSTRLYPEWPFAAMPHIDEHLARDVTAVMLTLGRDEALMRRMKIHSFTVPADYAPIVELLRELRVPPFDTAPKFTLADVWKKYFWFILVGMTLLGLVVMLTLRLLLGNRRLSATQQLLSGSEARYRATFEHAAVGIARISLEGRFLEINEVFCGIIGYTSEEVLSQQFSFQQITFADDLAEDMAHVRHLLESDENHYEMEKRYIHKDGGAKWVHLSVALLRDEAGKPLYFISSVIDIGGRKQAEWQLRRERDFAESLINTAPTIVLVLDKLGCIVRINPYMEALSGYSLAEVVGRDWFSTFLPTATREQTKSLFLNAVNDIKTSGNIDTVITRSGEERIIEWYDQTLRDADGNTLGLLAIGQDITERKKTLDELENLNRDFVALLENTSDFLYFKDSESRIRFCSQSMARIVGRESWRELIGKHDLEIFPPQTAQIYYEEEFPVLNEGKPLLNKIDPYFNEQGKQGWVSTNKWPVFSEDGRMVVGIFGISRDVTERIESEIKLKAQSEALQRSNTDLERFAYSVSHDMRQPLRAVSGHLQLLARSLKDKLDVEERENLGFALDGAKRMDSMIVSLLDYSRVGRKTEAKKAMDSRESLDEAIGFLEPMIRQASAQLSVAGEWPQVYASRDELTRLFQNLIGNALHYHEPDQPPRVEVTSSVEGGSWRVSVRDHGIGIDPQQIDRLFQFFSRLQSRARFEGAGMGLALCRRIVEHHGGRIWAESEGEGKGSAFVFEMPLVFSVAAEATASVQ